MTPRSELVDAELQNYRVVRYDIERQLSSHTWTGLLTVQPPETSASLEEIGGEVLGYEVASPWWLHDDGTISRIVLGSNGESIGTLTARFDGTWVTALDFDRDGIVDLFQVARPDGAVDAVMNSIGEAAMEAWAWEGLHPLCMEDVTALLPGAGELVGCGSTSDEYPAGGSSPAPDGMTWRDPFEFLCHELGQGSIGFGPGPISPPVFAAPSADDQDVNNWLDDVIGTPEDQAMREAVREDPYNPNSIENPIYQEYGVGPGEDGYPSLEEVDPDLRDYHPDSTTNPYHPDNPDYQDKDYVPENYEPPAEPPKDEVPPPEDPQQTLPVEPGTITTGMLASYCRSRGRSASAEFRERLMEALDNQCTDPAAMDGSADDCFGAPVSETEEGSMMGMLSVDQCPEGEATEGCEPDIQEQIEDRINWAALGSIEGVELCNPMLCNPGA